jgi:hypothetical protein
MGGTGWKELAQYQLGGGVLKSAFQALPEKALEWSMMWFPTVGADSLTLPSPG